MKSFLKKVRDLFAEEYDLFANLSLKLRVSAVVALTLLYLALVFLTHLTIYPYLALVFLTHLTIYPYLADSAKSQASHSPSIFIFSLLQL